ncbi:hypothetical protein [Lacticaseibacillus absianus]|uniref:hypothetical protein n=1 Tax=Lacticaseibacillus absianus TaxID=2729623 RepID=UPI0015CE7819|nr:hypothetical protein [Lacticaseibacillus absianus]
MLMDWRQDIRLINERIDLHFDRHSNTRYWLSVVRDPYDQTINFFFWTHHRGFRQRSIPLHSLHTTDLHALTTVIAGIRAHTQLSITYYGFTGLRWPDSGQRIQARAHPTELLPTDAPPVYHAATTAPPSPTPGHWVAIAEQIADNAMAADPTLEATTVLAMDATDPLDPACLITLVTAPPDLRTLHLQVGPTLGWGFAAPAIVLPEQDPATAAAAVIAAFTAAPS